MNLLSALTALTIQGWCTAAEAERIYAYLSAYRIAATVTESVQHLEQARAYVREHPDD